MAKRLFDIGFASAALVLLAPLMAAISACIRLASPGPVLYRARRVGRGGLCFVMHKFRTMNHAHGEAGAITGTADPRVFRLGALLRKTKLDELPQLFDVLRGEMSIVGPRPEDPQIVEHHYSAADRETLRVRPGLASPGSLYNYTHGNRYLSPENAERDYVVRLLPVKLALERVYLRQRSMLYDLQIVCRTIVVILQIALGRSQFADPPEMAEAERLMREDEPEVLPACSGDRPTRPDRQGTRMAHP